MGGTDAKPPPAESALATTAVESPSLPSFPVPFFRLGELARSAKRTVVRLPDRSHSGRRSNLIVSLAPLSLAPLSLGPLSLGLVSLGLVLLSSATTVSAEVVLRERFEELDPSLVVLNGSATDSVGEPMDGVRVTASAGDAGSVWLTRTLDDRAALAVSIEFRIDATATAIEAARGGLQVLLQSSSDVEAFAAGGDGLGTGAFRHPYVGAALRTGGSEGPRVELHRSTDPSTDPPIAVSTDLPELAREGAVFRLVLLVDGLRVSVVLQSVDAPYRAREVVATAIDEPLIAPVFAGVTAAYDGADVGLQLQEIALSEFAREPRFVRGDCNQDGVICGGVTDLISIVLRCFQGGPEFPCEAACDANDDGVVCGSVSDVVFLANHCFLGGPGTPEPARVCGVDSTGDALACPRPSPCADGADPPVLYLGRNANGYDELFRRRDGMVMIEVPAGRFEQGDHFLDFGEAEIPVHEVAITQPFLLAKYEVTNAQYRRFLDAIDCRELGCARADRRFDFTGPGSDAYDGDHYPEGVRRFEWALNENYFEDPAFADYPVIWVDWFDAVAYGRWASGDTRTDWSDGRIYGIPTESQWEYAARFGGDGRVPSRYPWGGSDGPLDAPGNIGPEHCNFANELGRTEPVWTRPMGRSHFGAFAQAGNVYEWTADWYDEKFYAVSPVKDPFVSTGERFRQLRGGGWFGPAFSVRGAYRCNFRPEDPDVDVGIRCAMPR